jgi:hypothetical protein
MLQFDAGWLGEAINMSREIVQQLILLAGVGQLVLAAASLTIPGVLGWRAELQKVRRLTRQVFWTYSGYIWATNVAFGLISAIFPDELLNGSSLAASVTGFIALYWGARCLIQWCWFDRRDAPQGWHVIVAEIALNFLFVALTAIYASACWQNLQGPIS